MRGKAVVLVFALGACSDFLGSDRTEQELADPAPTLTITSATFHSVLGTSIYGFCGQTPDPACGAPPAHQVRWGTPATTGGTQSGLGWEVAGPHTVVYCASFPIGTLSHLTSRRFDANL